MVPRWRNDETKGASTTVTSTATTPETAKNIQAVRMRSATPVMVVRGHQPGDPLDGGGAHPHVEQPQIADDGQQHDPQAIGAGAQMAKKDPGEEQADQYGEERNCRSWKLHCGPADVRWHSPPASRSGSGHGSGVLSPSTDHLYLGHFGKSRDHRIRSARLFRRSDRSRQLPEAQSSRRSAETKASWGTSTRPMFFIFFFPSFCFSRSLRFRVMSPP